MAVLDSGPAVLDWAVYAGDSNEEYFQIIGESPVDLSGATITAQARAARKDPTVAATAVVSMTDPEQGAFAVSWDGEELRGLVDAGTGDVWKGVWDLQVEMDGVIETRLAGKFTITYDVTRGA